MPDCEAVRTGQVPAPDLGLIVFKGLPSVVDAAMERRIIYLAGHGTRRRSWKQWDGINVIDDGGGWAFADANGSGMDTMATWDDPACGRLSDDV
ncbi:hypothetical protein FRACA_1840009 [Frankia canadensis]|uniref:Uncharacterized protein n=1 Tax=Frankia canadensis TaxID=1836972 RepID=A0A2I2KNV2_9ACTN|nr:hypothetical protein FRACA_1840009 [Frankia canadensis]SOU54643.1 hypothetical protein FRACA_1840009 [Frankia canadensis]